MGGTAAVCTRVTAEKGPTPAEVRTATRQPYASPSPSPVMSGSPAPPQYTVTYGSPSVWGSVALHPWLNSTTYAKC